MKNEKKKCLFIYEKKKKPIFKLLKEEFFLTMNFLNFTRKKEKKKTEK